MTFHDVRFPVDIAFDSEGGPSRRTDVVALVSGREERNSPAAGSRRSWNAGYGVKSLADIEDVIAFFEARMGRLHAFRFRDPFDWKSCRVAETPGPGDQTLATGDGARTRFPLVKRYASGPSFYERRITRPVAGSVVARAGGAERPYTVDGGDVVFASAPPAGAVVTAGFLFDTPVRFDTDSLRVSLAAFRAGEIPSIPLIEVLE
ncbi:MAG: DUF2460 domain-containing protein [Parvularculaceae bacterium]|nr:DUF2460 domain-containing protein [Parvularculaceae bacterium]